MTSLLNEKFDLLPIINEKFLEMNLSGSKNEKKRNVYVSGVYLSLVLALYYEEAGRPLVNVALRPFLENYHEPQPTVAELVSEVSRYSHGKVNLDFKHIPNYRYRYGIFGPIYVKGVRDTLDLCLNVIPNAIMESTVGDSRGLVFDWLNRQMQILNPLTDDVKLKYVND